MTKNIPMGKWIAQMEEVPTFVKMSRIEGGNVILNPISYMQRKWAEAIKTRLNKDGFESVSII